jgi:uncharacterized membrane protein
MALFSMEGLAFVFRWLHYFAGVIWIGLLYYFNFVHGAFMAEAEASAKPTVVQKLLPKALWWFRYGALYTFITGALILGLKGHTAGMEIYATSWGVAILVGAAFGTLMFLNVWGIIWRNQKKVIAGAPDAAAAGAKALLASRTNVMFSIPMLFFMGAASHLPIAIESGNFGLLTLLLTVLIGALELNAIFGKLGRIATIKGVITAGFILTAVVYALIEIIL